MSLTRVKENLQSKSICVVNLDDKHFDSPVYRVFSIERLLQLFHTKLNTLVKPSLWDDPFENIIFQQKALLNDGQSVSFEEIRETFYGQCWTLNTIETDALWRIYSPYKSGVRVQTTLRKLWDSFYNPNYQWASISFFIGKIEYVHESELKSFFENPDNLSKIFFDTSRRDAVQTLFLKRKEFEYENEVRLIYAGNKDHDNLAESKYQYLIEPNDFVDELLFDPRIDNNIFNAYYNEIKKYGFNKIIEKSQLYQVPKFNLRFNH